MHFSPVPRSEPWSKKLFKMMQILQKALDWFKSLFWKVSFATTLIRVINNAHQDHHSNHVMFLNVKSAKGQYQLMFDRRRWSSPWSDFR